MRGFTVGVGPRASGIYALYFRGSLVYIGKASTGMTKGTVNLTSPGQNGAS